MTRTLYNNYEICNDERIAEYAKTFEEMGAEVPEKEEIEEMIADDAQTEYIDLMEDIANLLYGEKIIMFGTFGRWNGQSVGAEIGTFKELYSKAVTDCDYIKIDDENGHLILTCSHHDGTNSFEFRVLTKNGWDYLENWKLSYDDKRTWNHVSDQIIKRYSRLPRIFKTLFVNK